ncbi:MAG: adenylosuccinate lyase [Planctomycetes bacterium]|nr:adenylosuccinate lyase [Planctomycetota bacterium]NUQ34295.1 adenylosuccinate lyase [Planctomycetaceae bacterium]
MAKDYTTYDSPLVSRYAAKAMRELFSPQKKFSTWRRLWLALAESQHELGLKQISSDALKQMRAHLDDINFDVAEAREREVRHDVMSHVHAYGQQAPAAAGIIHLGATSCYVTDNADLIVMREALVMVREQLVALCRALADFAEKNASVACLGSTHFQVAQLVTVGKRATLWLQDVIADYEEIGRVIDDIPLRGVKGTTGTQASFLNLFDGDHKKVRKLEEMVCKKMGFERAFPVTGQTYPRKWDHHVLSTLSGIGVSLHKFASDMRLLMGQAELEEPFETSQIGSSAMPYKRNPMRSERICSLSRHLMSLAESAGNMASQQWLERTLDDSAIRRVIIPEAFLTADIILSTANNIAGGIVVNHAVIAGRVARELPLMASEEIIMECVRRGGDRQHAHEAIRTHSHAVVKAMRETNAPNDLFARLKSCPEFKGMAAFIDGLNDPEKFVGRAPDQVMDFLAEVVRPLLKDAGHGRKGDGVSV